MGAAEEAVVTAFMDAWGDGTQAEPDVDTILPMFTERVDQFTSNGIQVAHHLVAVFDISDDGHIAAWREYFDPEDVNRQLRAAAASSAPKDGGPA